MKINETIISIPPYISTSWNNITTLYMKGNLLVIILREGELIHIPGLMPETVETIFSAHATFIEKQRMQQNVAGDTKNEPFRGTPVHHQEIPFKIGFGNMEGMGAAMQHNPSQANMPDLPEEILNKIGSIAKALAIQDIVLPVAEPHCNCPHCQIARSISKFTHTTEEVAQVIKAQEEEEPVADLDLKFEQWSVQEAGENLFSVTNKLDTNENYRVFLGNPVGCTCGQEGCEHLLAVLRS